MTISISYGKLNSSMPALREIGNLPLDLDVALKLRRVMRQAETNLSDLQEIFKKAAFDLADKEENGEPKKDESNPYGIKFNVQEYNKAASKALTSTVEINGEPLMVSVLAGHKISSSALLDLDWLFIEEDQKEVTNA